MTSPTDPLRIGGKGRTLVEWKAFAVRQKHWVNTDHEDFAALLAAAFSGERSERCCDCFIHRALCRPLAPSSTEKP